MCGLVGIVDVSSPVEVDVIVRMRDTLRHRGPDDAGEWRSHDGMVGLGHRRLAIVDLSPRGHQPMMGSQSCIVFNGEIYNFRELRQQLMARQHAFRSATDTEVVLAAYREWGIDFLSRLHGMFAFALYDPEARRVILARDRAGEKPMFYRRTPNGLQFASQLNALLTALEYRPVIDRTALDCYLANGSVPGDLSIVEGIHKLPPAHALVFDLERGTTKIWRYWDMPLAAPELSPASDEALLNRLEELLSDSVRRQLLADVPVGVLLSGGVDSSLVTAMAARSASGVRTFTVRLSGHSTDESAHARLIARHFGTEHFELDAGDVTVELLQTLARRLDEPLVDSSIIPTYLVSQLTKQHCTVALGGDGGDELFGGYLQYNRLLWTQQRFGQLPRTIATALSRVGDALPIGFKGRAFLHSLTADLRTTLPSVGTLFDPESRRLLMARHGPWPTPAEHLRQRRIPLVADLLQRATRMDFQNYLPDDLLVKVDRASMFNSLEVRSPFLDHRLVEFAFGEVPSRLKATPKVRKLLLKRLAARVLPTGFDQHRKQGFKIPLSAWLRGGAWKRAFEETLMASELFDHNLVRALFAGQERGRANADRLFGLYVFDVWRREHGVAFS